MRCPECAKQRTRVHKIRSAATLPRVTYALIVINVAAFLAEGGFSFAGGHARTTVIQEGILSRYFIAEGHEYWRLVTSGFLHENLIHIGFNMYLLYLLGLMLEPALGSARFGLIYATALLAGSFGALFATGAESLGASGAVFGLMGAAAVELRARRLSIMESGIGGLILINLVLSFTLANISVGAHVGGLIGGALAAAALRYAGERKLPALGYAACLALCAIAVAGALIVSQATGTGIA